MPRTFSRLTLRELGMGRRIIPPTFEQEKRGIPSREDRSVQSRRPVILFVASFTVAFAFLTPAIPLFAANNEQVLHTFDNNRWAKMRQKKAA